MKNSIDHTETRCTYIGDGAGCSNEQVAGRSYCPTHMAVVYQKGSAAGRRNKDIQRAALIRNLESAFNDAVQQLESEGFDVYGEMAPLTTSFDTE